MQDKILQIDSAGEEGECRRGHRVRLVIVHHLVGNPHFEGAEGWERSRINFREPLNVFPVCVDELEALDLSVVGREQSYGADGIIPLGDYV